MLDSEAGFENSDWGYEVRGEDYVVFPVDRETVRIKLFTEDVERPGYVFRPFVDDVEVIVSFDEAAR
jgi:hypothetical protein